MILPFATKLHNGLVYKRTYFIEKIWKSIEQSKPELERLRAEYAKAYEEKFDCLWDGSLTKPDLMPKPHTIREDAKDRWHPGKLIHMVVFNRTKNQFQFAPVLVCTAVQKFEITAETNDVPPQVYIDGRWLVIDEIEQLAKNDGFETVDEFFKYFNKDFTGKIIHWTDLRY